MQSAISLPRISALLLSITLVAGCGSEPADGPAPADEVASSSAADVAAQRQARAALAERVTVSGVSSGGYMAVQAHVALADVVSGVASVAGGPWHCAEGNVANAIGRCLSGDGVNVPDLLAYAYELSASEAIAPVDALASARVWIFHSPDDAVVSPSLSAALAAFYGGFVDASRIEQVTDVAAAHGWPTLETGVDCGTMGGDFMNACDYDTAGVLLAHLYGELEARTEAVGSLGRVDLSAYFDSGSGVAADGFLYVPTSCSDETGACRLHVAFHGCRMGAEFVEDRFARGAGYNEWAEDNRIVVAYPQVAKSAFNPQGCWDWWGYTGADYDRRSGKQIAGVAGMIEAFQAGELRTR